MADFHWRSFIDLAETLFDTRSKDSGEEAVLRTVVNRAYYGAFKLAYKKALRSFWISRTTTGSVHRLTIMAYKHRLDPINAEIAALLEPMFHNRLKCDYHNVWKNFKPLAAVAESTLSSARRIAALL